jgi:hypothetical protein
MWDTTNLNRSPAEDESKIYDGQRVESYEDRAVVSHISRKTSEIWGTQDLWSGRRLKGTGFSPYIYSQTQRALAPEARL